MAAVDPEPGAMGNEPRARDRGRRDHSTTDKRDESPGAKLSAAGWTNSRLPATGDVGDRQTAASETERQKACTDRDRPVQGTSPASHAGTAAWQVREIVPEPGTDLSNAASATA